MPGAGVAAGRSGAGGGAVDAVLLRARVRTLSIRDSTSVNSLRAQRALLAQLHPQVDHLVAQLVELGLELCGASRVPIAQLGHVALGQVDVVLETLHVGLR